LFNHSTDFFNGLLGPWLDFKSFERQVKTNVDPMELQRWAMNWTGNHSDGYYGTNLYDGTNFPSGFRKVTHFDHGVHVLGGHGEPSVWIFGTTKGGPALVVGSASLVAPTNLTTVQWKPGIYFADDEID
jgi:hypothetical protein